MQRADDIRAAFRRAKNDVCSRHIKQEKVRREPKSYAQVETSVEQQVVRRKSGGLKPENGKAFRIGIRLSSQERQLVIGRANNSGLKLST